jgi:NAD-dependent SIR2 family protein deacetylase
MPDDSFESRIEQATSLLANCDALLIGAGAGLSAAAGYDFTNPERFSRDYPGMLQYGFTHKLQMMANFSVPETLLWGYYLQNVAETRFDGTSMHPVYQELLAMSQFHSEYFVITTNVDALFQRNGFDSKRLYTPQGDYGLGQCRLPCSPRTWSSLSWIEQLLPMVERSSQMLPLEHIPQCPYCGGPVFFNVRCASWFVEEPWLDGRHAYDQWLENQSDRTIVAIDIGSGFNTPMWVRWPLEALVEARPGNSLIRLNRDHPDVPPGIASRTVTFREDPLRVLKAVREGLGLHAPGIH